MLYTGTEGVNGWEDGGMGEGPAGATVPYDVRGLHAARGAIFAARRGDNRSKLKINPQSAIEKKTCTGP